MIVDIPGWFRLVWPTKGRDVISDYVQVGTHKHFLADVAQRGCVWGACHVPGDPQTSLVNEGRRQMALEIIELAGEDPRRLFAFVERPATKEKNDVTKDWKAA